MEDGYQSFVNIAAKDGSDDFIELPVESNETVLLSTVQAQFPSAIGLKYKSSSGGWRGIRAENNVLDPPHGGWGEGVYIITESDAVKRKTSEQKARLLEDLIVLGLPYSTTEEELNALFTDSCGELTLCELKVDRETKKSRGFGFIRFKTEEGAQAALKGHHEIEGRKLNVRLSKRQDETPMKLFVGRLAREPQTTRDDVNDYFSEFGNLTDVFVPSNPFRGFAFITYSSQEDARKVLRMNHDLQGARLNVTAAEPKEDRGPERKENFGISNYSWKSNSNPSHRQNNVNNSPYGQNNVSNSPYGQNTGYRTSYKQEAAPVQKDVVSELKDMICTLINNRK